MPKNSIRSLYVGLIPHRLTEPLNFGHEGLSALSQECHIATYEKRLTHKKRMMLTKEKNYSHKQRKLTNDERPVKGSNWHETHFRRAINGCQKMAFVSHALTYAALVRQGP